MHTVTFSGKLVIRDDEAKNLLTNEELSFNCGDFHEGEVKLPRVIE